MRTSIVMAAVAAFLVASGAALAQRGGDEGEDDEYRGRSQELRDAYRRGYERGYDRGYRKGLEAGDRRAPPPAVIAPPPPPVVQLGPIQVTGAYYGSDQRNCQAGRQVARLANGKRSYSFKVTNEICGDPDPGKRKTLEVTYNCGQVQKTASAREHQTIYFDCSSP